MRGFLDAPRVLETLDRHRVQYVLIGALGATLYGSPLRTADIDICPSRDRDSLDRLGDAMRELNAKEWDPRKDDLFDRDFGAELFMVDRLFLLATDAGPVDLVFEPAGSSGYDELIRSAVTMEVDGVRVVVASLEDIIRSKEITNREKDRQHLSTLRRLQRRLER